MEERSVESLTFSVRVFTLQEEVRAEEEHMETHEEEVQVEEGVSREQQVSVCRQRAEQELTLFFTTGLETQLLTVQDANRASVFQFTVSKEMDCCQVGGQSFLVTVGKLSLLLQFKTPADMKNFQQLLKRGDDKDTSKGCSERDERENKDAERGKTPSRRHTTMFESRTENAPTQGYQFHSCLFQQQSLLQDYLRIATYQRAILVNETDFRDKVVLDVCCGSGILSFFAVQAGATRVYAVEASPMARFTQILVQSNCLSERIRVLEGEVEEVSCPDMVDIIVSEPMGYMLLNDRLMESFLHARKWLKPNGLMFPSYGDIHLAPFSDEQLYFEHYARASFWQQRSFYGVNLSALHSVAVDEFFRQPIVDTFDVQILMARSVKHCINFMEAKEEDLHRMEIPFVFTLLQSGLVHGLAFWFDVAYLGSKSTVWLSTAPTEPLTRWYQVRCLLQTPLFAKLGQTLSGTVLLAANNRQSYDIHITATVDQSGFKSGNILDLKNPFFRIPSWFHS
ncbi:histone-arginine methyltransferase CARM1 isoform X2 [Siniperca chuatsi]|uniref:histone-arginine methyltransferase CARM1 isoform X2 n=1 Tax=Siniperca chuatsi TaxID=119488 RepID=UPI001CE04DA5|nr:histone-arginine methyltransferase CARM1 isoform X2 [Siniperca chuatsi]XP_044044489.1 histone-arginine methyltransferase CARM1 isoform X2 [Siniperca chuatsi]